MVYYEILAGYSTKYNSLNHSLLKLRESEKQQQERKGKESLNWLFHLTADEYVQSSVIGAIKAIAAFKDACKGNQKSSDDDHKESINVPHHDNSLPIDEIVTQIIRYVQNSVMIRI